MNPHDRLEARERAIEALREAIAAGTDRHQVAAFAEICVDNIIDACAPDPQTEHEKAVEELRKDNQRMKRGE